MLLLFFFDLDKTNINTSNNTYNQAFAGCRKYGSNNDNNNNKNTEFTLFNYVTVWG